jgi:hypothetical protein
MEELRRIVNGRCRRTDPLRATIERGGETAIYRKD